MKTLIAASTALMAALLILTPALAFAATPGTITVNTNSASYSTGQSITITGSASPAPAGTPELIVQVTGPSGVVFREPVTVTSGSFSVPAFPAAGSDWVAGTYTVLAGGLAGYNNGTTTFTFTTSSSCTSGCGISQQQYNDIIGNITAISTQLTSMSAALQTDLAGNFSILSSISARLTTLSNDLMGNFTALTTALGNTATKAQLTQINGTLTAINNNVLSAESAAKAAASSAALAQTASQNASSDNSNTQTYVLVVAVLAAIDLVLVLAVLIRKLS